MPRLGPTDDSQMEQLRIGGKGFSFSGTKIAHLGATEYTLVTIAVDETGSVADFATDLRTMLVAAVSACKKSPRSDNILIRVITFASRYPQGVKEIHGFKPLAEIDTAKYPDIKPGGNTPLCDACYSAIGATNAYGASLIAQDFGVNGILFVITDGEENCSTASVAMVKAESEKARQQETLESLVSVLVGVNAAGCRSSLTAFKQSAGMTQYVDVGDATPRRLAKLAEFVSTSVSSQSQSIGSGGASQNIAATI